MEHDPATAARLADALGGSWLLQGRLPGQYGVLREVARHAEAGSDSWCAVQLRIILAAVFSADPAGALEHATALRDAAADRCCWTCLRAASNTPWRTCAKGSRSPCGPAAGSS